MKIVIHSVSDRGKHPLCRGTFEHTHDARMYVSMWASLSRQAGVEIDITIEGLEDAQRLVQHDA